MALKDLWQFENAPVGTNFSPVAIGTAYATNALFNQYTGIPAMLVSNGGTGAVTSDGFLQFARSSGYAPGMLLQLNTMFDWVNATQYWFGFRTKLPTGVTAASDRVVWLSNNTSFSTLQTLLLESDLNTAGVNTSGTENWVEVFLDRNALTFQVWVNGVQVKTGALTAGPLNSGAGLIGWNEPNNSTTVRSFREFYFLDVTADGIDAARLGPLRSQKMTDTAATGSEYTLNGAASLLAAVSTALQNPPVATPNATSPTDKQPLVVSCSSGLAANTPVVFAVQPQLSAAGSAAGASSVGVSITANSQTANVGTMSLPNANTIYNQRMSTLRKAPDGSAWSVTAANNLQMTVTPQ